MVVQNFTYDDCLRYCTVSRETFSRLEVFVGLLEKWQKNINLISAATLPAVWMRHIIDSAQLNSHLAKDGALVDIGAGAGFPGLVLGILGRKQITLVESDRRKAAFLQEAARVTGTEIIIRNARIEEVEMEVFPVIMARAFSSLHALLECIGHGLKTNHKLLLLKGKNWAEEINEASRDWSFEYTAHPSITDAHGVILSLGNPHKREASA